MPTYEYKCLKCRKTFEKFQSMTEAALKTCIFCKGKVERLIGGGAGIIFKGSGFYETDYKRPGSQNKKPDSKAAPAEKKEAPKSKPETKKD